MTTVQRKSSAFVVSDAVALVVFALIGLVSHHKGLGLHGLVRDAVPVLVGWFVVAVLIGTYRRPSWAALLLTWLVGVTGGVFVRGLVLQRHLLGGRYLTFLAVALTSTLVLILALRGLVTLLTRSGGLTRIAAPSGRKAAGDRVHPHPDGSG